MSVKIKIIPVKKSQKVSVKIWNAREKILKSAREMQKVTVKKTQKEPKMAFTGTFDFHGEKKKRWAEGSRRVTAIAVDPLPAGCEVKVKVNECSIFGPLFFLKLIYIIDHVYT